MNSLDSQTSITRRAALGAFGAAAAGYAFMGGTRRNDIPTGRIVLDYWEKWTGHEAAAMQTVVDAFNASQDRWWVNYLSVSGLDRKAKIAIAAEDPPDLLGLWHRNIPFFRRSGALLSLESLGRSRDDYASVLRPILFGDVQDAAPTTCSSIALYYDRAMFREFGFDPDQPPATIPEFDEVINALTIRDQDGKVERAGFLPGDPGWWNWSYGPFFGGQMYDAATDQAMVNSPGMIRAYEWVQSFPQRWGLENLRRFQGALVDNPSPYRNFFSGRLATTLQGPWVAKFMQEEMGDNLMDYAAAPFPVDPSVQDAANPHGSIECDVLVVPRNVRHPEGSLAFVSFLQQPENLERLASGHGKPSPLVKPSSAFLAEHPNRSIEVHQNIMVSKNAFAEPFTEVWPEFSNSLGAGMSQIDVLQATPSEAFAQVQEEVQAQLTRAAARRALRESRL